jgi:predicted GH43/DUF377 family glycosyl hydrolase
MPAKDVLAAAAWVDRQRYLDRVLDLIARDGSESWFEVAELRPLVIDLRDLAGTDEVRASAALYRLAGRVVMSPYSKGRGGELAKLWFLLRLLKRSVGVELFGEVWQHLARQGLDFTERLVSTIRGHWGHNVTSAHNAFENRHQRIVAARLKQLAEGLIDRPDRESAAKALLAAANVYHLSITLPDATFVPFSAWTWASYSYRGGVGSPTPLSSLVERDWATRDFVVRYLGRAGMGDAELVDRTIAELMAEGREREDLSRRLLGVTADPDEIVRPQTPESGRRLAGMLRRPKDVPILWPIEEHPWESRSVRNAAAVRLGGTVYLLYGARGADEVSRIGLAWSLDGIHIEGRLDYPIYEPTTKAEARGCEDPRVVVIGNDLYMLYTATDGQVAQVAMASIPVQAFLEKRFDLWDLHGLALPGLGSRDAVLYPEVFDGRYAVYHRIDPNIWVSYVDTLTCPWPRTGHSIVAGPRTGMMWDGVKIGAGAQPLKTVRGWLNIYHGVDHEGSCRLGVLLMALEEPARVVYRSPNAVLAPETEFELGRGKVSDLFAPRTVFTCGAVPAEDKAILDVDDEILVYYTAAETAICLAIGKVRELVPCGDEESGTEPGCGD